MIIIINWLYGLGFVSSFSPLGSAIVDDTHEINRGGDTSNS